MCKFRFRLLIALLTFGISVLVVSNFFLKTAEPFVIIQQNEEIKSAKMVSQNIELIKFDDLKINGVGLDSSYSFVIQQLGKPLQSKKTDFYPCTDSKLLSLKYSGLVIELVQVNGQEFNVVSIELTSSKGSIPGIKIDEDISVIEAKFGKPTTTAGEWGILEWSYGNTDGGVTFDFKDKKLKRVAWGYNFC